MIKSLLLLILVLYFPVIAWASELFIQWQAPTSRKDGKPLKNADIIRYNIQVKGPYQDDYHPLAPVLADKGLDRYEFTYPLDQDAGEYCFQLQTLDSRDFKSPWSDPKCVTYTPITDPTVPGNISIETRLKPAP